MKYLKYFQESSEYTEFKNSSDYVLPNVSYVVAANDIYYEAPVVIPNNEIWYISSDGEIVTPHPIGIFDKNIISISFAFLNCIFPPSFFVKLITSMSIIIIPENILFVYKQFVKSNRKNFYDLIEKK